MILTADEANKVRGLTIVGHALAPVPLKNGTFVLPNEVLTDPAHAIHVGFLDGLSKTTPGSGEHDLTIAGQYNYENWWEPGKIVKLAPPQAPAPVTMATITQDEADFIDNGSPGNMTGDDFESTILNFNGEMIVISFNHG